MHINKIIDNIRFVNARNLWASIHKTKQTNRASTLMMNVGVEFFDDECIFISKPSIAIMGLGGLPIYWDENTPKDHICIGNGSLSISNITDFYYEMFSFGANHSYLNPYNLSYQKMISKLIDKQHFSVTHLGYINLIVSGISISVENEFNSQRDIIHISRLTENRTKSQCEPPIVVLYPELLQPSKEIYFKTLENLENYKKSNFISDLDFLEGRNALFPASKGTLIIISGTIKNLLKLTQSIGDVGKEEEYRRVLLKINDSLFGIFPDIFTPTKFYDFNLPKHWGNDI